MHKLLFEHPSNRRSDDLSKGLPTTTTNGLEDLSPLEAFGASLFFTGSLKSSATFPAAAARVWPVSLLSTCVTPNAAVCVQNRYLASTKRKVGS